MDRDQFELVNKFKKIKSHVIILNLHETVSLLQN